MIGLHFLLGDAGARNAVQQGMIAHCELMGDRMAILDPPPGLNPQQIKEWRVDQANYDSKYAALYWPWIKVADPLTGRMIPQTEEVTVNATYPRYIDSMTSAYFCLTSRRFTFIVGVSSPPSWVKSPGSTANRFTWA